MIAVRKALVIAVNSVRRLVADKTNLFFILFLPFLITFFSGIVFGEEGATKVAVVAPGGGGLRRDLVNELRRSPVLSLELMADERGMRRAVRKGDIDAGVVVPASYDADVRAGRPVNVVLIGDLTQSNFAAVRSTVDAIVAGQATRLGAVRFAAREAGATFAVGLREADRAATSAGVIRVQTTPIGERRAPFNQFSYTAPANLVLFVFVNSLGAAGLLVRTRRLGVARRMLSTPTSSGTILIGEFLGRLVIALLQSALILGVGSVLFGVSWGDPLAAIALVVVFALGSTGGAMLLGSVLRTEEQAIAVGAPVGIALGMLGGCMWPLDIVAPLMRTIGHVSPHAWAMDAWDEVMFGGGTVGDIVTPLVVLADFAIVLLLLGLWRMRRALTVET